MNALSHTHKHALARQCLPRERRGCDTTITQGAWLLAPPLLSMDMKRGNACKASNGYRMHAQPHLKTEVPRDAS
jgi:hypothetical protein